jgi:hypothetical protein
MELGDAKREHWEHPHYAEQVLISNFSFKPPAMPQPSSCHLHNFHENNGASKQSFPLFEQVSR